MQIDINVKTYSTKQRILAFFMAFLIFTMTCPEIFEGWGIGLVVHAVGDGQIHSTSIDRTSKYTAKMNTNRTGGSTPSTTPHTDSTFVYTGNYNNNNKTTLFDYVSDYELKGTYNTCQQNESGFVDVFTALNNTISQSAATVETNHVAAQNIVIVFKPHSTNTRYINGPLIYVWEDGVSDHNNNWPGKPMIYDKTNSQYYYIINRSDTSSPYYLNFDPNRVIFNGVDVQSPDINPGVTMEKNNTYYFEEGSSTDDIKLIYRPSNTNNGTSLKIHLWNSSRSTIWPGVDMTYSTSDGYHYFTTDFGDFIPTNFKIHNNNNWDTGDKFFKEALKCGWTYVFSGGGEIYESYPKVSYVRRESSTSRPLYNTIYSVPLYFGDFWRNNSASGYSSANKPAYNNFFWQANLGMKSVGSNPTETSPDHFNQRGHAAVQNLVYGSLSGENGKNYTGDILDKSGVSTSNNTISGNVLPMFSTAWINDADHTERTNLIKYYDKDVVNGKDYDITFPFYETYSALNQNTATVKLNATDSNSTTNNEVARFYQFDSKEANLKFNITSVDEHKGYFSESDTDIVRHWWDDTTYINYTKSDRSNVGFYPFNSNNNGESGNTNKHNLGFGTKMSMDFQLESDGCVSAVKLNNSTGKLESLDTETRIHTIFEFTGDDDLWVFIDGNLVLDMGGPHFVAHGIIDFADMSATADPALKFGTNSSGTETTAYDALDAAITTKTLSGSDFIAKLAGNNTTDGSGNPTYDTSVTHTMTIFYMERGMLDSNLLIRYNYSPISNTSRMKIAEVTKFTGVNSGLLELTKQAAEDDVFKYTVSNMIPNGVTTEAPLETGAKYPVTAQHIRTAEDTTTETVLTHNLQNTTPAEMKFTPGTAGTLTYVKNTSYWWVDGFSDTDYLVGKTTNSSGTAGQTGYKPGGDLWLMYGTNDSVYDSTNTGKESSAEFEKQFTRGSKMTIVQGDNVYRINQPEPGDPRTLFDVSGNLTAKEWDGQVHTDEDGAGASARPSRAVDDYYTTKYRLVDRAFNTIFNETSEVYKNSETGGRNATFDFNNASTVSEHLATMLTEYVENTVNTRNLAITKNVSGSTSTSTFTLKVTFEDVFGVDSVDLDNNGYGNITITGSNNDNGKLNADGTFSITAGQTATISGIPYGTTYTVVEPTHPAGATVSGEVTTPTALTSNDGTVTVVVTNTYESETGVDVLKKNGSDTPLEGAEFELWYKETLTPPTYIFNEPELVPNQLNTMKVTATPAQLGVPGPEIPKSITTYKFTTEYEAPTLPDVTDKDWILPRNDTDYIYFRDYNTGTTGWEDSASFNDTGKDAANTNGSDGKCSWRGTEFDTHQEHNQNLELFFDDNDTYWMAAEFSGGGKKTIRYAMWERFVDKYDKDSDGTEDVVTTVWKIQPPDGYTHVKFMMLSGDTVIRETQSIPYELGKIYHKTSWGKWTKRNNIDSYYDVLVTEEGYWAPHDDDSEAITDSRMSYIDTSNYTGKMLQARKYEPTAQKVIFHCNSTNVWHNIHIEFFTTDNTDTTSSETVGNTTVYRVNGQAFPGYMMEPYAYAGDNYRVGNYLTYELTIPANATHFRITNGEPTSETYGYYTAIMPLRNGSTAENGKGQKNYGNYWCFDTGNYTNKGATLIQWTGSPEGGIPAMDYKNAEVTSDYDYIYFDNSTANWSKVYAYFYAGGNLRADNWQRACYSSWPGVAPAGTEYGSVHSNTYSINTTDNTYNGTNTSGTLSPETTINGGTVYKFRIPKGDRTNYSKVVFNNGLKAVSGGQETGVIEYQPGHIYTVKGKATKHYENSPTVLYEASTVENTTEYIYVQNTANWDDLHITFYDANGGQILQQGKGYVMDYADTGANTGYFKIPLPKDAAKFSVNNGIGNSSVSPLVDIVRLNDDGTVKTNAESGDEFAYELTDTTATSGGDIKLTRLNINTTQEEDKTQPTPQEEGFEGYTKINNPATSGNNKADPEKIPDIRKTTKDSVTTEDTLCIRDMAGWNAAIGKLYVTFYRENGTAVGPNVAIKTVADSQNKKWYTKKIPNFSSNPVNAFTVTYIETNTAYTTPKYPIYPNTNTGTLDGVERTESGCMFFDTQGSGVKSTLVMTNVEPATNVNTVDDETYPKRGDFLYLTGTSTTAPSVTFYASGINVIKSGVQAKYINKEGTSPNIKYWYKVSIPDGAQSFTIAGESPATQHPIYELKSKVSWYEKDYTLGDMQYRFNGTTATCVYPVFTPTPVNKLEISSGHTLTSKVAVLVDGDAIADYQGSAAKLPTTTGGSSQSPEVLYNTSTDDVTYSWTVGTASAGSWSSQTLTFTNTVGWSDVWVKFWGTGRSEQNVHMTNQGSNTWTLNLSGYANNTTSIIENVIFHSGQNTWNGTYQTGTLTSSNGNLQNSGFGQTFTPTPALALPLVVKVGDVNRHIGKDVNDGGNWGAYFWKNDKNNGVNISLQNFSYGTDYGRYCYVPDGYTHVNFYKGEDGVTTVDLPLTENYGCYNIKTTQTNGYYDLEPSTYNSNWNIGNNITGSFGDGATYSGGTTQTPYKYAYQPEDRYSYISDVSSTTDTDNSINNFIKVTLPSSVTTPYIKFYNGSTYINNETGSTASTKGLPLNDSSLKLNDTAYTIPTTTGEGTKTYQVRLPKNATKFEIFNDTTSYGDQQSIDVTNFSTTIGNQPVTLDSFRHAGSTFTYTVDGENNITVSTTLRSGFTPYKTATMTDPLKPMSDADFVFFTDTNGTFANSGKVYAYFYGDVDGEYKAWPGTMADSAASSSAATTYTNNNGDTVYKFRIPKDDDGVYSWVIFTDGAASPKITAAQEISGGKNYILGTDNGETYGTMTANVYGVSAKNKTTSPSTVNYNTSDNRTIYIVNNGTTCNAADETDKTGGRYILDDMHVEFFGSDGVTHVGTPEGYIPEKAGTHANDTVYRITVPSNAKFFRINNGNGKDGVTTSHNHTRNSEIKQITDNGLYQFVTETKYTKDGSDPTTVSALSTPEYLLTLTNKIDIDGDAPTSETYDVHLATIKTGSDGKTSEILWLRDMPTGVDTAYLANKASDIGAANKKVKVKKQGTYYWKEVTPPSGYKLSEHNIVEFTLPPDGEYAPAEFENDEIEKGSLAITKKLHSVDATNGNTAETGKLFTFTIELNAPVGSNWSDFVTNPIVSFTGDHASEALIVANSEVITGTNRKFSVKLPADGSTTATLTNIPYGTTYNITETAPTTDYSSTPIEIKYQNDTIVEEMKGTVNAATTSYLVTDKHEVGSLTLKDIVIDRGMNALYYAGVNQPKTLNGVTYIDYTKYDYYVILEAPAGIDLKDYISMDDLKGIISFKTGDINCPTGNLITYYPLSGEPVTYAVPSSTSTGSRWKTTSTSTIGETSGRSRYLFHIDVTSSVDGAKTISNIPIGTQYSVVEVEPTATYEGTDSSATATDYTGTGVSWFGTAGVPDDDPGTITLNYQNAKNNNSPTVTITNYYRHPKNEPPGEVILTKTAKEKVGTTDIGDTLAGAQFKLLKVNADGTTDDTLRFAFTTADNTNKYTLGSGSYNQSGSWLTTGTDGKLHIFNLAKGDYYLEEQAAPNGYSHLDSNTGTNKKVYFSVGANREVKEISATDEMAPAYIKLFEHIDMKKKAWGNPTFVFKIKQTQHYELVTENNTTEWKLNGTDDPNGKEILVALTVDDNINIKQVYKWFGADGTTPTLFGNDFNDPINTGYNSWFVEGTTDLNDYQGLFNIDSKGRIRVEPGKYEITRVPVSRYEFVTNGKTAFYDNDAEPPEWTEYKVNNAKSEKLTIDDLPAGKTIDVHYYDKVGYYDKFSQVKEAVNQFYTLDANKANKTIKGIRVEDYKVDTVSTTDMDSVGGNGTLTTLSLQQSRRFKAYYIYADGSESQITDTTELAKFVISYEYDSTSGDNANFATDFFYDETNDQISVANYSTYKNGVYTLKATYDSKFSANFDIVFERS